MIQTIPSHFKKRKNMQTQYNALSYRIDLYFHEYEIERQKPIKQGLGFKFIRIDPEKQDFDIFRSVNEIFSHIKKTTKKR